MSRSNLMPEHYSDDWTFGVELELIAPLSYSSNTPVRNNHGWGLGIDENLWTDWRRKTDCSIETRRSRAFAVEIVSPKLRGLDGLEEMSNVIKYLWKGGCSTNASCGFHVHVGVDSAFGDYGNEPTKVAEWLSRLLALATYYEAGLLASTGAESRLDNAYCCSVRGMWRYDLDSLIGKKFYNGPRGPYNKSRHLTYLGNGKSRYAILNTLNATCGHPDKYTVEFRVWPGTLSTTKAEAYVQLALGLCQKALCEARSAINWRERYVPESRFYSPEKTWKSELEKLVSALGWRKCGNQYGLLRPVECAKARYIPELMRLANKLDETASAPPYYLPGR